MKVVSSKLTVYIFLVIHVNFKGNECGIFLLSWMYHKVLYFLRLRSKVDLKNVTVLVLSSTYSKSLKGTNTGLK